MYELGVETSHYMDITRDLEAFGLPQYQPNVQFLDDYQRAYDEELRQLGPIETELAIFAREAGVETSARDKNYKPLVDGDGNPLVAANFSEKPAAASTDMQANRDPMPRDTYVSKTSSSMIARQRINDRIFEILRVSPLERARHKAFLGNSNLDDQQWLSLVKEYWERDQGVGD